MDFEISFENVKFIGIFQGKKNAIIKEIPLGINTNLSIASKGKRIVNASFEVPDILKLKQLTFRIGLKFYGLPVGYQGNKIKVITK